MSAEHPNAVAYRRAVDAFRVGDLASLDSLIDTDVVWHLPGAHARAVEGRDALFGWLKALSARGFWIEEHDVFGSDEHVCALSVIGMKNDSLDCQTNVVSVFHYEDGRQTERWFYPEDLAVWDAIAAL